MTERHGFGRVREIFRAASQADEIEREALLERECAGDEDLRHEVEGLLRADSHRDSFLEAPELGAMLDVAVSAFQAGAAEEPLPRRLGRYTLKRLLGRGGMGVVYEAEQDAPHRTVALKLIIGGGFSKRMQRRFEQETEALGRLRHPGIAQIYDAGTIQGESASMAFFAMELVEGVSLDKYARANDLTIREKITLLIKVSEAMSHAHQHGVIHRDLKPANILVEGDGQTKILDFGVARITDNDVRATTIQTSTGQIIGTVAYMSPEQASGDPEQIDTRSDVYSIGVLAYELFTRRLPVAVEGRMIHEAVRAIREDDPTPLATGIRGLGGDLQTIVGKALEKDKERRYQSAAALADDLGRFLRHEPISARPPSSTYQLRKFARRHKPLVIGTGAVFAVLLISLVIVSLALRQARRERAIAATQAAIAEEVNTFLNDELLASADPDQSGRNVTVLEVLNTASERIEGRFTDQPLVEASIRSTIGETFRRLGDHEKAEAHLDRAYELRLAELGEFHADTLQSINRRGSLLNASGKLDEARELYEIVLERRAQTIGETAPLTISAMSNLGGLLRQQGKFDEAARVHERAVAAAQIGLESGDRLGWTVREGLAGLYKDIGEADRAILIYRELLELHREHSGPESGSAVRTMNNLAVALRRAGQAEESLQLLEAVVPIWIRTVTERHPAALASMTNLGRAYMANDRFDDAVAMLERSVELHRDVLGPEHRGTLITTNALGLAHKEMKDWEAAETAFDRVLEDGRSSLGLEHPLMVSTLSDLALTRLGQDDPASARGPAVQAAEIADRLFDAPHSTQVRAHRVRGSAHLALGEHADAEVALLRAFELSDQAPGVSPSESIEIARLLVEVYAKTGQSDLETQWRARLGELESES